MWIASIDGPFGAGTFHHVIRADPAGELSDNLDRVFPRDIDGAVRAQLVPDREPRIPRAGQDHGLAPKAFATATASSPIGPGPITTTLSPATSPMPTGATRR